MAYPTKTAVHIKKLPIGLYNPSDLTQQRQLHAVTPSWPHFETASTAFQINEVITQMSASKKPALKYPSRFPLEDLIMKRRRRRKLITDIVQ